MGRIKGNHNKSQQKDKKTAAPNLYKIVVLAVNVIFQKHLVGTNRMSWVNFKTGLAGVTHTERFQISPIKMLKD
jgi:hypothetical protein